MRILNSKCVGFLVLAALTIPSAVWSIPIDPGVPPGGYTGMGPLSLPIPFEFRTSDRPWTEAEKDSAIGALSYLGSFFVSQPAFQHLDTPEDFSLRWAGEEVFGNHSTKPGFNHPDWDLRDALAIAVKPRDPNTLPWNEETHPQNEVYFNIAFNWHFNPLTNPPEGDPNDDTDGYFDFWSILIHEAIHMLCVDKHSTDPGSVMYPSYSDGERKWELKDSDLRLLREAGYEVVPEPMTIALVAFGSATVAAVKRRGLTR